MLYINDIEMMMTILFQEKSNDDVRRSKSSVIRNE